MGEGEEDDDEFLVEQEVTQAGVAFMREDIYFIDIPGQKMWTGEQCDGQEDVDEVKQGGGQHQVVEVTLVCHPCK